MSRALRNSWPVFTGRHLFINLFIASKLCATPDNYPWTLHGNTTPEHYPRTLPWNTTLEITLEHYLLNDYPADPYPGSLPGNTTLPWNISSITTLDDYPGSPPRITTLDAYCLEAPVTHSSLISYLIEAFKVHVQMHIACIYRYNMHLIHNKYTGQDSLFIKWVGTYII